MAARVIGWHETLTSGAPELLEVLPASSFDGASSSGA